MEINPLVTIIVPAYNVEKWLCDCLNSIKNQTYQNWECIIVNDGSKDKTHDIALEFCSHDTRFRLIDKENEGVSTVRNVGLDNAKGNFIQFIDGDDMLPQDCLEYCVNKIGECHILACDCIAITETENFIRQTNQGFEKDIDRIEALKLLLNRKILSGVWSKFYRKDIIDDLKFNVILRVGEDISFNTELFLKRPDISVRVSTHPIYKYRIVANSVSRIRNKARCKKQLAFICNMDDMYEKHKDIINKTCLDEYARNIIREILFHYSLQGLIKKTDASLIPLMRKWHTLLVDKSSTEYINTKFVEKEISFRTDWLITLRYLPDTMRRYIKNILRKVKK